MVKPSLIKRLLNGAISYNDFTMSEYMQIRMQHQLIEHKKNNGLIIYNNNGELSFFNANSSYVYYASHFRQFESDQEALVLNLINYVNKGILKPGTYFYLVILNKVNYLTDDFHLSGKRFLFTENNIAVHLNYNINFYRKEVIHTVLTFKSENFSVSSRDWNVVEDYLFDKIPQGIFYDMIKESKQFSLVNNFLRDFR